MQVAITIKATTAEFLDIIQATTTRQGGGERTEREVMRDGDESGEGDTARAEA